MLDPWGYRNTDSLLLITKFRMVFGIVPYPLKEISGQWRGQLPSEAHRGFTDSYLVVMSAFSLPHFAHTYSAGLALEDHSCRQRLTSDPPLLFPNAVALKTLKRTQVPPIIYWTFFWGKEVGVATVDSLTLFLVNKHGCTKDAPTRPSSASLTLVGRIIW